MGDAFRDAVDYQFMVGGQWVAHPGNVIDYTVDVTKPDDPIMQGVSDFDIKDELYYHIQMQPGVEALATTYHDGGTWPVAWTRTYGKGRVFHTPLGHRDFGPDKPDPLQDASLAKVLLQGIDWVAGKP